jgi:hypothetical protein
VFFIKQFSLAFLLLGFSAVGEIAARLDVRNFTAGLF